MTGPTAAAPPSPQQTAARVEEVLDRLGARDPAAAEAAEQLVRALMDFYAAGLARVVGLLSGRSGAPLSALLDDEVTAGLLVLHDLHPDDLPTRVGRALRSAGAESVEVMGIDEASGLLSLRRPAEEGHGCGCGSSDASLREQIEAALSCFAPEIDTVEISGAATGASELPLLQIGRRPGQLSGAPAATEAR